jgi:hypothetical protein
MENKKKKYIAIGVVVIVLIIATVLTCTKKDNTSNNSSTQSTSTVENTEKTTTNDSSTADNSSVNNNSGSTNSNSSKSNTTNSSNITIGDVTFTEEEWNAMSEEEKAKYVDDSDEGYDENTLLPKYDSAYDSNGNKIKDTVLSDDEYINTVDISQTAPEWNNITGAAVYVGNLVNKCGYYGRSSGSVKLNYDGWAVTSYENIVSQNSNYKNLYRLSAYTRITQKQCMYNILGNEKCFNNRNANNYIVTAYITVNDDGTAKLHRMYVSKIDTDDYYEYAQILADDGMFDSETIAYLDSGVGTVLE